MKVTIKGTSAQVMSALSDVATPINRRARKGQGALATHQQKLHERRELLRRAFLAIRHNPARREEVDRLARALGGSEPVTPELMATALNIVKAQ